MESCSCFAISRKAEIANLVFTLASQRADP
jgi:hypothetical protein